MDAGPLVKFCFPKKRLKSVVYKKRQSAYLFRTVNHSISITSLKRSFKLAAVILALTCGLGGNAHAALVDLIFYVDTFINTDAYLRGQDGNLLADGSIIQIILSANNGTADGFQMYGSDRLLDTTQGDDVILATITSGLDNETGRFYFFMEDVTIDLDNAYFYIRFFDYQLSDLGNLVGVSSNLYWGQSALFMAQSNIFFGGVVEIDFGSNGDLQASTQNSFTVIPEPSTMSFFALMGGMVVAMRNQMIRRKRRQQREGAQVADESPTG
jgi:hypothetical protein